MTALFTSSERDIAEQRTEKHPRYIGYTEAMKRYSVMRDRQLCPPASAEVAALQETGRCCLTFGKVTAGLQANEQLLCLRSRLLTGACLGLADAHGALALTRNGANDGQAMGVPCCDTPSASIALEGAQTGSAICSGVSTLTRSPIQWPSAGALNDIRCAPHSPLKPYEQPQQDCL